MEEEEDGGRRWDEEQGNMMIFKSESWKSDLYDDDIFDIIRTRSESEKKNIYFYLYP
jgi:hypothetical protein